MPNINNAKNNAKNKLNNFMIFPISNKKND